MRDDRDITDRLKDAAQLNVPARVRENLCMEARDVILRQRELLADMDARYNAIDRIFTEASEKIAGLAAETPVGFAARCKVRETGVNP